MNLTTLKKYSYITGVVLFVIVLLGCLKVNDFEFDNYLFDLDEENLIPFSILSLLGGALMIFGMQTKDAPTTLKRCKNGSIVGGVLWAYLLLTLFFHPHRINLLFSANWLLLGVAASALVVFAIKYSLKKE